MADQAHEEKRRMKQISFMNVKDKSEEEREKQKKQEEQKEQKEQKEQESPPKEEAETKLRLRKNYMKHMKMYPELYRSDVSIHPSYTTLKILPYDVVCRRRVQRVKKQIKRQLSREVMHFAMMQMFAIDSVRIDRIFSVGMPPKTLIVPDFVTLNERRHINKLLCNS